MEVYSGRPATSIAVTFCPSYEESICSVEGAVAATSLEAGGAVCAEACKTASQSRHRRAMVKTIVCAPDRICRGTGSCENRRMRV